VAEIEIKIDAAARDRIGKKWVEMIERRIDSGEINATESATLIRLLVASGYSLDPSKIPMDLQHKLTEDIDLEDPATAEELGIIPFAKKRTG
jgi:hypothetical protein